MNLRTLSVTEAVEATGFSRDRIYDLVRKREVSVIRGEGDGRRAGNIRIVAASLEDWMTRNTTPAIAATPAPRADADRELPIVGNPIFS